MEFTPTNAERTLIPDKSQKAEDASRKNIRDMTQENDAPFNQENELAEVMEALEEEIAAALVEVRVDGAEIIVEIVETGNKSEALESQIGLGNIVPQEVRDSKVSTYKRILRARLRLGFNKIKKKPMGERCRWRRE